MQANVNADLYQFLKDNECHISKNGEEVTAIVFVAFGDLADFVEIVGDWHFADGDFKAVMKESAICIPIIDIIYDSGHDLSAYKNCFPDDEWEDVEAEILEMEAE